MTASLLGTQSLANCYTPQRQWAAHVSLHAGRTAGRCSDRRNDTLLPMNSPAPLPPGQRAIDEFPRFGLLGFARRFPAQPQHSVLTIQGEVDNTLQLSDPLQGLPRVEQRSDFHCVTTWTHRDCMWGGVRFCDFFARVVVPNARPDPQATLVALRAQDGARTAMLLSDLLAPNVLLADTLNGRSLGLAHGAPLRLVAPAHYGYKSIKHLARIDFRYEQSGYETSGWQFMDHLRARVALEERGRFAPGILLRYLYRPFVSSTIATFAKALAQHSHARRRGR